MEQEHRQVYYDGDLEIEAYHLSGVVQKFPNHFHDYYVIGFVEGGKRHLECRKRKYDVAAGDMILFNPRDNHCCEPIGGEKLDYRAINIKAEIMSKAVKEITGRDFRPFFTRNVVSQCDITPTLGDFYNMVVSRAPRLEREETLFFLLEQILAEYSAPVEKTVRLEPSQQIKALCAYLENHYTENISLDEMLTMTSFGKSYLLRSFTKQVGVSPYRYLQSVRLDRAKKLLQQNVAPIDAAVLSGFSDQSHFTNFFKEFIGLTPKQYQRIFTASVETIEPEKERQYDDQ
jgi:AraC-like DNA-binding protein/mannose-6-phosphate isomerase-like protein (cupin superfamily)